jgi:hypothetical protein
VKFLDIARQVVAEHGAVRFRPKRGQVGQVFSADTEYDVLPATTRGKKRGWVILDAFSASMVVKVHDALKPENRAHLLARDPIQICAIACRLLA